MGSISLALALALFSWGESAFAQGVTTATMSGVVRDAQGQVIPGATVTATHEPSGTTYAAITQADGRFLIPGVRVGGPYSIRATLTGFSTEVVNNLTMNPGITQDLQFTLKVAGVAPIWLDNFVGAGVNTVTRSGTNTFTGSVYHRFSNEDFVGTEAKGLVVNPGTFNTTNTGFWFGGPAIKNKLFGFVSFERQHDTRPLTLFRANKGNEPASGSVTRVLASDMDALSAFLSSKFGYTTGPYENIDKLTPGKPLLLKGDYNLNSANKAAFRYTRLTSSTDALLSTSSSLGIGRNSGNSTNFLGFKNSNYSILENIDSSIGEWNSVISNTMSNSLIVGYTHQDESRGDIGTLFPFVDILDAAGGIAYTSFGSEPFTPNNELRYDTFQVQDNFTKFGNRHSLTFGGSLEKYHSENVFFPGKQSAYVYNSLADFYTDVNGYLANPNRSTSPVTLRRFQVRYSNIPGQDKPIQPLDVWYSGGYVQDEWRPSSHLTVTAGLRVDVAKFGDTAYANPSVDALTFRDEAGNPIKYSTGKLPNASPLWSPRVGFNWDISKDQRTQLRGGSGVFTGKPAYVWISNQVGNTGVLTGFIQDDNVTTRPFDPNPDKYKPTTVTGASAASVDLAVTDPDFKFPQVWRTNVALDRRLPWGLVATGEFIYTKDINGIYYLNANLPAAQSAFVGADNRPRWTGVACAAAGQMGPCVTRINNAPGNQITNAIVMKNEGVGTSWNVAGTLAKTLQNGFAIKGAYSYGEARNTIDAGSIASGSFSNNVMHGDPNNPGVQFSGASPGHRVFVQSSYTRQYFDLGSTTVSVFWEGRTNGNTSYLFATDMNGDTGINDAIYIPRNTSEMNFQQFSAPNGRIFTAAEQAQAWEAYINQDGYLRKHRGEYAERFAVFLPLLRRMDLSVMQDVFHSVNGMRHSGQVRLDITNAGNLINHDWGVGQRLIRNQILTNGGVDANGAASYRMALVNNEMPTRSLETTTFLTDVYQVMVSFRYSFQR